MTNTKFGRAMGKKFKKIHTKAGAAYLGVSLKGDGLGDGFDFDITQNNVSANIESRMRENIQQPVNPSLYAQQPVTTETDGFNSNPSEPINQPQNDTAPSTELPDCPDCGANEWTMLPDGSLKCPCGRILRQGEY